MINLDGALLIGKGLHRKCFQHPQNPSLCIKIVYNGNMDESRREQAYYRRLQRRGIDWQLLPRYHGEVNTDRGVGAVFDLIRDEDGGIAKTLEFYLGCEKLTAKYRTGLVEALRKLRDYLLKNWVVTMTLKPKNIVYRRSKEGGGDLVVIDNIGNSDFIPVCNYLPAFARRKIRRKWVRFESYLLKLFPENRVLREMLSVEVSTASEPAVPQA